MRLLVERLEGRERVTDGGIVIPATAETSTKTRRDLFRARVRDMSDEVDAHFDGALTEGDVVLVYAYGTEKTFTGEDTRYGTFIDAADIVCVVDEHAEVEVVNKDISKDVKMNFERPRGKSKRAA